MLILRLALVVGALLTSAVSVRAAERWFSVLDGQIAASSVVAEHQSETTGGPLVLHQQSSGELTRWLFSETVKQDCSDCLPVVWRIFSSSSSKPLPGALVWWGRDLAGQPYLTESTIRTDESGRFRGELSLSATVRVWAAGHQLLEAAVRDVARHKDLILQPGGSCRLRFVVADGPVGGVELRYRLIDSRSTGEPVLIAGRSDSQGLFVVPGVGRDQPLMVEIVDPRFQFSLRQWGDGLHDVVVKPASSVRGSVVQGDGQPLEKVQVEILLPTADEPGRLFRRHTETDSQGRYRLTGLPDGRFLSHWRKQGHKTKQDWLVLQAGTTHPLPTIVLAASGETRLRIVDRADEPVANALVTDLESEEQWLVAEDGTVGVPGPLAGSLVMFEVRAEGFLPQEIEAESTPSQSMRVVLRRADGVLFEALRLEDLSPITELKVEVQSSGETRFLDYSDPTGSYSITGLSTGAVALTLRAAGALPQRLDFFLGGGVEDLGLVLFDSGASVEGTLLLPGGFPAIGARLSYAAAHPLGRNAASRLLGDYEVVTDVLGKFRMSGFSAGSVCLKVQPPQFVLTSIEIVELQDGERRVLPPRVLGPGAFLAGEVVDRGDTPLPGVRVEMRLGPIHNPCLRHIARADSAGRFSFSNVGSGTYHLVAIESGQLLASRRVVLTVAERVDGLKLEVARIPVAGLVTLDGLPATGGQVQIVPRGSDMPVPVFMAFHGAGAPQRQELLSDLPSFLTMKVGVDGKFSGAGVLLPGDAEVVYRTASGATYHQSFWVSPAETVKLELRFRGEAVRGRVVDPGGLPTRAAKVALQGGEEVLRQVSCDRAGRFTIRHVPPGSYRLVARAGTSAGETDLRWPTRSAEPVDIVLRRQQAAELRFEVFDREDQPAANVMLTVQGENGARRVVTTDATGRATLAGLPPGSYDSLLLFGGRKLALGPPVALAVGQLAELVVEEPAWTEVVLRLDSTDSVVPIQLRTATGLRTAAILSLAGVELWPDAEGKIQLPALSEGSWQVGGEQRGWRSISVRGEYREFDVD